jgi:hypothetical protein
MVHLKILARAKNELLRAVFHRFRTNGVSSKTWRGRRMGYCMQFFIVSARMVFHKKLGAGEEWVTECSFSYRPHHITAPRPYLSATQQAPT